MLWSTASQHDLHPLMTVLSVLVTLAFVAMLSGAVWVDGFSYIFNLSLGIALAVVQPLNTELLRVFGRVGSQSATRYLMSHSGSVDPL